MKKSIYKVLRTLVAQEQKERIQRIFWIYFTYNYSIKALDDFKVVEPNIKCGFILMTMQNYPRVSDFRETGRVAQYRLKLATGELGFFAEYNDSIVGSIWATINKTDRPQIVRKYMKLLPGEALIHDGVASERMRGKRIGPYMVSQILTTLIKEYQISRIVWDVHFMNHASMRMLDKLGLHHERRVVSICAFGRLMLQFCI